MLEVQLRKDHGSKGLTNLSDSSHILRGKMREMLTSKQRNENSRDNNISKTESEDKSLSRTDKGQIKNNHGQVSPDNMKRRKEEANSPSSSKIKSPESLDSKEARKHVKIIKTSSTSNPKPKMDLKKPVSPPKEKNSPKVEVIEKNSKKSVLSVPKIEQREKMVKSPESKKEDLPKKSSRIQEEKEISRKSQEKLKEPSKQPEVKEAPKKTVESQRKPEPEIQKKEKELPAKSSKEKEPNVKSPKRDERMALVDWPLKRMKLM